MALQKCPICELNYIKEGEKYCNVCKRNLKGGAEEPEDHLCVECGENKAIAGNELCAYCLAEKRRRDKLDKLMEKPTILDIEMEQLDEMEVPLQTDVPEEDMNDIREEFGDDEETNGLSDYTDHRDAAAGRKEGGNGEVGFDDEDVAFEDGLELIEDEDEV